MPKSTYKSNRELKYLARMQTGRYMGILIGTVLLNLIISYGVTDIVTTLVPSNGTVGYIINYVAVYIAQIIVSVLDVGVAFIFMKSACNMKSSIKDLFFGYQHHFGRAVRIGLVIVTINSICMIPLDIATIQFADIIDNNAFFNNLIGGTSSDTYEMLEAYSVFASSAMKYYVVMLVCSLVSSLLRLPFFPAYYMLLDFPNQSITEILKKCFEVMHGNMLRLVWMYVSFIPLILLSMFTFGIAFIWVIPYMKMTAANFYLDMMAVRNRNM
jgi:uncharacterized membrane protein